MPHIKGKLMVAYGRAKTIKGVGSLKARKVCINLVLSSFIVVIDAFYYDFHRKNYSHSWKKMNMHCLMGLRTYC